MSGDKWCARMALGDRAKYRLFCLPYAGGGTTNYARWPNFLGPDCEVLALRLPGRETRWGERLIRNMDELIETLLRDVSSLLDRPFAIQGHSMGGRIGFELARALRLNSLPTPSCLFVSACRAPHLPKAVRSLHSMPEAEFLAALTRLYDGIPKAIMQDREMLNMFLPMIRADIELFESAVYVGEDPLDCPIVALCGTHDNAVARPHVEEWRLHTHASFSCHQMAGGHFFLNDHVEEITALIRDVMEPERARRPASADNESCSPRARASASVGSFELAGRSLQLGRDSQYGSDSHAKTGSD